MMYLHSYANNLFVAQAQQNGAILLTSTSAKKMSEMYDKFKTEHPNMECVIWGGYDNYVSNDAIKATEDGAYLFRHTTDKDNYDRLKEFTMPIYKVIIEPYATPIIDYYCSSLKKAKQKVNETISKGHTSHIYSIYIVEIILDTDEENVVSAYMRDEYGRFTKEKNMDLVRFNYKRVKGEHYV